MRMLAIVVGACGCCMPAIAAAQAPLESGGLAPPEAIPDTPPPSSQTEAELRRADEEDSGRGLEFFWLDAEIGFQHVGLQAFTEDDLFAPDYDAAARSGLGVGAGLGIRLIFVTLGARFRFGTFQAWQLWSINGEVGLRFPFGDLEPYVTGGAGFSALGSFESGSNLGEAGVSVNGVNARLGGGLDWYLSDAFSIGGSVTGDVLFLRRSAVSAAEIAEHGLDEAYAGSGSSIGAGLSVMAVAGLHF